MTTRQSLALLVLVMQLQKSALQPEMPVHMEEV